MPRSTNSTLESLLPSCRTESTVEIVLRDGTVKRFCTGETNLVLGGETFEKGLLRVGELKETLGQPTNRINVTVSNVENGLGLTVAAPTRKAELADCTIKRLYIKKDDPGVFEWKHFFTGKAVSVVADEKQVSFDVTPDTTAAGTCIATETLSPLNGWKFPEIPDQSSPGSGGNPGGGVGGGSCFTGETEFVLFDRTSITFDELFERRNEFTGQKRALSFDDSGNPAAGEIKAVFRFLRTEFLSVSFADGSTIEVTAEHPFFTENFVYTEIGKLQPGSKVFDDQNELVEIVKIETVKKHRGVWVYNVEIGEFENYSAGGKRVHNKRDGGEIVI